MQALFLFTDIVNSTRMWDRDADSMDRAMNIHDEILRTVISDFTGEMFKHTGDGMCATFTDANAALRAAIQGQINLAAVPWPQSGGPHVRMALHFGTFREHAGDYFGRDVCLARRILELAPGGCVLITEPAVAQMDEGSRDEAWLLDMGRRHLRGVSEPVRIYRVASLLTKANLDRIGSAY